MDIFICSTGFENQLFSHRNFGEAYLCNCLAIDHSSLFLPAVVRPILDSFESSKQVPAAPLSDVVAGMTGKKQG